MKKLINTIAMFLFIVININAYENDSSALEMIYNNREYIANFLSNCKYKGLKGIEKPCVIYKKELFISMINEPYSEWQKNEKDIFNVFNKSCAKIKYLENNNSCIITDEIYIKILVSCLKITDEELDYYAEYAAKYLIEQTARDLVRKYGEQIKNSLKESTLDKNYKFRLLSLLELDYNEKEELLKRNHVSYKHLPLWYVSVVARLGDTNAEDYLIGKYNSVKDTHKYNQKEKYLKELIFIGTKKSIKNLIKNFNEPIFNVIHKGKYECVSESIRYPIIKGLRLYHPYETILNNELDYFHPFRKRFKFKEKEEEVKVYLKKFKNWAYKTYGVKPIHADPKPILRGFCIK